MSSSKNPVPIPQQDDKKEAWGEWSSRKYNEQYNDWKPWAEDQYLRWFGKDNKASYATKGKTPKRYHPVAMTKVLQMHLERPKLLALNRSILFKMV